MIQRRYICVHALYGKHHIESSLEFFDKVKSMLLDCTVILVQNQDSISLPHSNEYYWLRGSNSVHEFSAWQEGLSFADTIGMTSPNDVIMLTNDTIVRSNHLRNIATAALPTLSTLDFSHPVVLGPVEYALTGVTIFNGTIKHLIATYFLAISRKRLAQLGGVLPNLDWDKYLATEYNPSGLFIHTEYKDYNQFYNAWLGAGQALGIGNWPGSYRLPYTKENFTALRQKAKTILLESHLAVEIKRNQFQVIDLYHRNSWQRILTQVKAIIRRKFHALGV